MRNCSRRWVRRTRDGIQPPSSEANITMTHCISRVDKTPPAAIWATRVPPLNPVAQPETDAHPNHSNTDIQSILQSGCENNTRSRTLRRRAQQLNTGISPGRCVRCFSGFPVGAHSPSGGSPRSPSTSGGERRRDGVFWKRFSRQVGRQTTGDQAVLPRGEIQ